MQKKKKDKKVSKRSYISKPAVVFNPQFPPVKTLQINHCTHVNAGLRFSSTIVTAMSYCCVIISVIASGKKLQEMPERYEEQNCSSSSKLESFNILIW